MIGLGRRVPVFAYGEVVDMRNYAERSVMRRRVPRRVGKSQFFLGREDVMLLADSA